jgi:hypothetical protein
MLGHAAPSPCWRGSFGRRRAGVKPARAGRRPGERLPPLADPPGRPDSAGARIRKDTQVTLSRPVSRRLALGAGGLLLLAGCDAARRVTEDGSFDLMTMLRERPEHRRFVNALTVSGQVSRVGRQNGAVTLFAPTNEAFNGLPAELLALLDSPPSNPSAEQRARVATLVNANAAFGLLRLADIQARQGRVVTWDRGRIQVNRTGERTATVVREGVPPQPGRPTIAITRGDVLGSDGVYHATSSPILPPA